MIFAHGPWYGELHHIPELLMAIPAVAFLVYWVREKFRK